MNSHFFRLRINSELVIFFRHTVEYLQGGSDHQKGVALQETRVSFPKVDLKLLILTRRITVKFMKQIFAYVNM